MDVTLLGQYQHLITGYVLDVKFYDQHRPLIVRIYDQYQHLGTDHSCKTRWFEPLNVRNNDQHHQYLGTDLLCNGHWKKVKISTETSLWFLYGFQKFHSLFKNQMWLFCGFLRLSFKGCKYPYKIHIRLINLHVMYGN